MEMVVFVVVVFACGFGATALAVCLKELFS